MMHTSSQSDSRQAKKPVGIVRHVTELALGLDGVRCDVVSIDLYAALVDGMYAADHLQRGGLASAVGAEEARYPAILIQ